MPAPQSLPDFLRHVASLDRKALDHASDSGGCLVPDQLAGTLLGARRRVLRSPRVTASPPRQQG